MNDEKKKEEREREWKKRDWNVKLIFIFYLDYYAKKICKHLLDNVDWVSRRRRKKESMARVVSNNNDNITLPTITPFMDRLTHSVIKETSKSL